MHFRNKKDHLWDFIHGLFVGFLGRFFRNFFQRRFGDNRPKSAGNQSDPLFLGIQDADLIFSKFENPIVTGNVGPISYWPSYKGGIYVIADDAVKFVLAGSIGLVSLLNFSYWKNRTIIWIEFPIFSITKTFKISPVPFRLNIPPTLICIIP